MNIKELINKSVEELRQELQKMRVQQLHMCAQKALGEVPKAHYFKNLRRDIARIKTVLHQKGAEL